MARPREPIELVKAKGKKHLTEKEIKERENAEIKVEINKDKINPPDYLTDNQKKEFNEIANTLIKIGILTELDNDCLARYILSKNLYLKYTSMLMKEINKGKIDKIEKYTNIQDKMFKQCTVSARELGLTISSRCKLVMPEPTDKPKENKFQKFLE